MQGCASPADSSETGRPSFAGLLGPDQCSTLRDWLFQVGKEAAGLLHALHVSGVGQLCCHNRMLQRRRCSLADQSRVPCTVVCAELCSVVSTWMRLCGHADSMGLLELAVSHMKHDLA